MSAITIYDCELDESCYKVRLLHSMLGATWTTVAVDAFPDKEQTTLPYLAMNPLGRLPILKDDDLALFETEAILAHLGRAHDPLARWLPVDGADFAHLAQRLAFSAGGLDVLHAARADALFDAPGDESAFGARTHERLNMMEDHMLRQAALDRPWFAAAHATIADIALFPAFALSRNFGIDHDQYPELRRWARCLRAIEGFITMPGIPDYH